MTVNGSKLTKPLKFSVQNNTANEMDSIIEQYNKLSGSNNAIPTLEFKPYSWLLQAKIYNQKGKQVPSQWIADNADVLVLLFTARNVDKNGVLKFLYKTYETMKQVNLPVEVIYIPMDETREDMKASFEEQANWFTLKFGDPLVIMLKYMYWISSIPQIIVIKVDGTLISAQGIQDLEEMKGNAMLTWISNSSASEKERNPKEDAVMYGDVWKYSTIGKYENWRHYKQ